MMKRIVIGLGVTAAVLVAAYIGFNVWLGSGDAADPFAISGSPADTTTLNAEDAEGPTGPSGTWQVALIDEATSGAGYRVTEILGSGTQNGEVGGMYMTALVLPKVGYGRLLFGEADAMTAALPQWQTVLASFAIKWSNAIASR